MTRILSPGAGTSRMDGASEADVAPPPSNSTGAATGACTDASAQAETSTRPDDAARAGVDARAPALEDAPAHGARVKVQGTMGARPARPMAAPSPAQRPIRKTAAELQLVHWRDSCRPAEKKARLKAVAAIETALAQQRDSLDLAGLKLTTLPDILQLLPGVLRLNVAGNCLSHLPTLPAGLQVLNASDNCLYALPALPPGLQKLYADGNRMLGLPVLPGSMVHLHAGGNFLSSLPPLPAGLRTLAVHGNLLAELPALPASLRSLNLSCNRIEQLAQLPPFLEDLAASQNQLAALPALPPRLKFLDVRCNQLRSLSEPLPPELRCLHAADNRLTRLSALPNELRSLVLSNNLLFALPPLPDSLVNLAVSNNQLSLLPLIPPRLENLLAHHNLLAALPLLPESIRKVVVDQSMIAVAIRRVEACHARLALQLRELNVAPMPEPLTPEPQTTWRRATDLPGDAAPTLHGLPSEVLLQIAGNFKQGTRSAAMLAQTSTAFKALLQGQRTRDKSIMLALRAQERRLRTLVQQLEARRAH